MGYWFYVSCCKEFLGVSDTALLGGGVWFYTAFMKCEEACVRGLGYSFNLYLDKSNIIYI